MDTAEALIAENAAFAELLREADLATPVPTCPDWTLGELMRHVGRGDRWCAQIVAEQSDEFIDPRTVPDGKPPADRDEHTAWLHDGPRTLIDAVARTGPDTPVWTFLGPRPADWWIRRRLHETAVHRADAALALGADFDIDPAIAADGITEYLERVARAIRGLGIERALVVRGRDGLDEITTMDATDAFLIEEDRMDPLLLDPAILGVTPPSLGDLAGGTADDNARILRGAIEGAPGPVRDILVVNAAAALWMAGIATDLADGMARAEEAATSGAAKDVLDRFIEMTGRLAPAG